MEKVYSIFVSFDDDSFVFVTLLAQIFAAFVLLTPTIHLKAKKIAKKAIKEIPELIIW